MRAGVTLFFQNYGDWDRYEAHERGEDVPAVPKVPDSQIWEEHLGMAKLVDELGFDSLWTVEHHISPYTMIPNPLQVLSYFAGATKNIDLGTMVVVLPWHDPLRVAEDLILMQHVMGDDRRLLAGFGRGAARREFAALGIEMEESKDRFFEAVEILKLAITEPYFSYSGKHYQYENVSVRPMAKDPARLIEDLHFSWGSPQSAPVGASLGLKPLVIPQKPWVEYHEDLDWYASTREEAGYAPSPPKIVTCIYCAETHEEARKGAEQYIPEYADSAGRNYELKGVHFQNINGYEHYADQSEKLNLNSIDDVMGRMYFDNHIWGTPEECIAKIQAICDGFGPDEMVFIIRYGSMTDEIARRSLQLIADEVLPAVHAMQPRAAVDSTTA